METSFLRLSFPIEKFDTKHSVRTTWDPSTRRVVLLKRYPPHAEKFSVEVSSCDDVLHENSITTSATIAPMLIRDEEEQVQRVEVSLDEIFEGSGDHDMENVDQRLSEMEVKLSPHNEFLALQLSPKRLMFLRAKDERKGEKLVYQCTDTRSRETSILGFYWLSGDHVLVVTTTSVEILAVPNGAFPTAVDPNGNNNGRGNSSNNGNINNSRVGLRSVKCFNASIQFHVYSHMTNMLLTTTDGRPSVLFPYRVLDSNLIKFNKLQLESKGSLVQRHELATVILYNRLYIVHLCSKRQDMTLYRFHRDGFIRDRLFNMFSEGPFEVSVVDNLLVLNNRSDCLTMLFDKRSRHDSPICPPMPISQYVPYNADLRHKVSASRNEYALDDGSDEKDIAANVDAEVVDMDDLDEPTDVKLYSPLWLYIYPNIILDRDSGFMFELQTVVAHIPINAENKFDIVEFFFRRSGSKFVLMQRIKGFIEQNEMLSQLAALFRLLNLYLRSEIDHERTQKRNHVVRRGSHSLQNSPINSRLRSSIHQYNSGSPMESPSSSSTSSPQPSGKSTTSGVGTLASNIASGLRDILGRDKSGAGSSPPPRSSSPQQQQQQRFTAPHFTRDSRDDDNELNIVHQLGYPAVDQMDMYSTVFATLDEEQRVSKSRLISVVIEYIRSLRYVGVHPLSITQQLLVDLLFKSGNYPLLHSYIQYKVISDRKQTAVQMLSLSNKYEPAYQIALDMMMRLEEYDLLCETLLSRGEITHALKILHRHHKSIHIPPKVILGAVVGEKGEKEVDRSLLFNTFDVLQRINIKARGSPEFLPEDECQMYEKLFRELFFPKRRIKRESTRIPTQSPLSDSPSSSNGSTSG